jgi:hypothetical protein
MEERKITIIEGPPPTFEAAMDEWTLSLVEGPSLSQIAMTRVRAVNGPALVERCYRAWRQREPIHLEFRGPDGLIQRVPIVAAHYTQVDDADVLRLWVAIDNADVQVEYEFVDDADEEDDLGEFSSIAPEDLMPDQDDEDADADFLETDDDADDDDLDDDDLLAGLGF